MTDFSRDELPATPDVAAGQWDAADRREALAYDAETETYRAAFDLGSDPVHLAVVSVVSVVADTPPMELPPLYDDVDPAALEALAEAAPREQSVGGAAVSVTYDGHDVTVYSEGVVAVQPPEASTA